LPVARAAYAERLAMWEGWEKESNSAQGVSRKQVLDFWSTDIRPSDPKLKREIRSCKTEKEFSRNIQGFQVIPEISHKGFEKVQSDFPTKRGEAWRQRKLR
jgi:hypothetical protein